MQLYHINGYDTSELQNKLERLCSLLSKNFINIDGKLCIELINAVCFYMENYLLYVVNINKRLWKFKVKIDVQNLPIDTLPWYVLDKHTWVKIDDALILNFSPCNNNPFQDIKGKIENICQKIKRILF